MWSGRDARVIASHAAICVLNSLLNWRGKALECPRFARLFSFYVLNSPRRPKLNSPRSHAINVDQMRDAHSACTVNTICWASLSATNAVLIVETSHFL